MYYDAIFGEVTIKGLVEAARKVEMETFKKHGMCDEGECWEETGEGPVGFKWGDTRKCDKEKPECRCRLVAKIKKDRREDLYAATPPLEAKEMLSSPFVAVCPTCAWTSKM